MVQSNIKIPVLLATKDVLPVLSVSNNVLLPIVNTISNDNSTIVSEINNIHINNMEYLANNFVHIVNIKNIAINLLSSKSTYYSCTPMQNFNFNKCIPLLERSYIDLTCNWGHLWSINTSYFYTVWLNLHHYSVYLIPLLGSLFYGATIMLFDLFKSCLSSLNPLGRLLYYIISNSLWLIIKLIELLFLFGTYIINNFYLLYTYIINNGLRIHHSFLYTYIRNNGLRPSLRHFIIWCLSKLDHYIIFSLQYPRICLYCNRFLSFYEYNRYITYINHINNSLDNLRELITARRELIRHLEERVSQNLYIIAHSNPRWNSRIHGRHILSLQVTNRYRLDAVNLNGQVRIIVALYVSLGNTEAQRTLLVQLLSADRRISRINPNYISEFEPLLYQLFLLEQTRSRIFSEGSDDFNNFIVLHVYENGHIQYRYTWAFH